MIVLDTNVLSESMRPNPDSNVMRWLAIQDPSATFITAITEAELRYGIALLPDGGRKRELTRAADAVIDLFAGRILPFNSSAAQEFAEIASDRRKSGRPISFQDAQICAIARVVDASLATRNLSDFQACGVELIDPWSHSGR